MGILAGPPRDGDQPFGKGTAYFRRIILLSYWRGGFCYAFSAGDVNPELDTIHGWSVDAERRWYRATCPMPDVVYDRWITTTPEEAAHNAMVAGALCRRGVPFVNSTEITSVTRDKLATHQILATDPQVLPYLPQTFAFDGKAGGVEAALSRYALIYLKPRAGSRTRGVVFLRPGAGGVEYGFRGADGEILTKHAAGVAQSLSDLKDILASEQYVVQQGICPCLYGGERFEIRVLMHKGMSGGWLRTGIVIRGGTRSLPFLASGNESHFRPSLVMPEVFGDRAQTLLDEVRHIARLVPPVLEANSGPGGELAIDVIIDDTSRVWLLEVNSKPASLFLNVSASRLRNRGISRVLDYAASLVNR